MSTQLMSPDDEDRLDHFRSQRNRAQQCINRGASQIAEGFLILYEIYAEESYTAEYATFEDFLQDFSHDVRDASRTLMWDRVRMVRRLKSLRWDDKSILEALQSPTVAQEALTKLGEWERGGGLIGLTNGVNVGQLGYDAEPEEVVSKVISEIIHLPRGEGRKYISEMTKEPQVYAILTETEGAAAIKIIDEDNGGSYEFFHPGDISSAVRVYLERVFGTRFSD